MSRPDTDTLIGWCVFLFRKPVAHSTIKKYLGALKSAGSLWNDDLSCFSNKRLEMCLRGIKKQCPHRSKSSKRMPVTIWVLRKFLKHLNLSLYEHQMIASAMIVAVYALLRAGEFAAKNPLVVPMVRSDVHFYDTHVTLRIRKSKTDIFREGCNITLWRDESPTCPYTNLKKLYDTSPAKFPSAPLFQDSKGNPLLYRDLVRVTKALALLCGFDPKRFAGHSFRIGGATTLALLGYEAHIIKTLGRWTSISYQLYTRVSQEQLQKATLAFSNAEQKETQFFGELSDTAASNISWETLPVLSARIA